MYQLLLLYVYYINCSNFFGKQNKFLNYDARAPSFAFSFCLFLSRRCIVSPGGKYFIYNPVMLTLSTKLSIRLIHMCLYNLPSERLIRIGLAILEERRRHWLMRRGLELKAQEIRYCQASVPHGSFSTHITFNNPALSLQITLFLPLFLSISLWILPQSSSA